ncbi:cytochrome P450 [Polyplosphaeria fusca]|uniref:Cytochrome P450 n=1 Tax=Polyplosphaeria fusca TaxID=682080 RepID=A0A9P4QL70_9PLEO|nr:cytochrome P450 [Polyplosphaeria fusca]
MAFPIILALAGAWLTYMVFLVVYRLHFSPIAKFPGPKLAALTFWFEGYYDVFLGGKYLWKIKELHEQYGPIVRINPSELHIADPDFWDIMYTASTSTNRREKWDWHAKAVGLLTSTLTSSGHALHRSRRGALAPFFSMANVRKLLPTVQERVNSLVERLEMCGKQGEMIRLEYAFSAFTNDVVMQYSFGRSDHHIEASGFDPLFHNTSFDAAKSINLLRHCNWILSIMLALPESLAVRMGEEVSSQIRLRSERIRQIEDIREGDSIKKGEDGSDKTIFHTLLRSDLPKREKENERLAEEAVLLVGAGTHTSSWCLSVVTFHLLSNPPLLKRLKTELKSAIRDPTNLSLPDLEKLPYLTAVLKEGLRLGYGVTVRSARIAPDTALKCGDWVIPPGTPCSCTIPLTHHDENIFPDSHAFKPERWLGEGAHGLDKYLVSFSKGSRACLGINLAWAEMYLATAGIFSHFGSKEAQEKTDVGVLELYETDISDVALVSDMFFPVAKEGSKGVRVKVSAK